MQAGGEDAGKRRGKWKRKKRGRREEEEEKVRNKEWIEVVFSLL